MRTLCLSSSYASQKETDYKTPHGKVTRNKPKSAIITRTSPRDTKAGDSKIEKTHLRFYFLEVEAFQMSQLVDDVQTVARLALDGIAVKREALQFRKFRKRVEIGELRAIRSTTHTPLKLRCWDA